MQQNYTLASRLDTERAAKCFAEILMPGDVVLLQGPVGAGKTDFARTIIQTRLAEFGIVEDVPSPTFTLVQVYEAGSTEIWHTDLYRLTSVDELYELGLDSAMETAICLIEWPERMGDQTPADAISAQFSITGDDSRTLELEWSAEKWNTVPDMLSMALNISQNP